MTSKITLQVQLGPQGRLVIPAELRRALGFETGDRLIAHLEDGRLVLEKREALIARLQERFSGLTPEVSLSDALILERREEARREAGE